MEISHLFRLSFAFLASALCNSYPASAVATPDGSDFPDPGGEEGGIVNQYIVKFKTEDSYASFVDVGVTDTRIKGSLPQLDTALMHFDSEEEAQTWAATRDDIEFVEQDFPVYPAGALTEETPYGITLVKALEIPDYVAGSGIKMCIIDSGYAVGHEDLPNNLVSGTSNFCGQACNWKQDNSGHGTHVAGTITAKGDNHKGVVGVVRNSKMPIHIVRVFHEDSTSTSNVISAMYRCEAVGANVVNLSLGSSSKSSLYQPALNDILRRNKKILFVAAAGNGGDSKYSWPASMPEFISVASVDKDKKRSYFSQYNDQIDLAAPGSSVFSTVPPNGYNYYSGTSMAAPHVAAVAAKIWSHKPSMTADYVRSILENTAEDLGTEGRDNHYGWGLVDALAAYRVVVPPTPAPTVSPTRAPTEMPTSDPTELPSSAPTQAPTGLPTSDPTELPSSAPTEAPTISFAPSNYPSIAPTVAKCRDSPVKFLWYGNARRCRGIRKNSKEGMCKMYRIKLMCPNSCESCGNYKCEDAVLPFYAMRGRTTTCKKLAKKSPEEIKEKCALPKFNRSCRKTCNTCLQ